MSTNTLSAQSSSSLKLSPSPDTIDWSCISSHVLSALQSYKSVIDAELYGHVLPFWLTHSMDLEHGGYWNCMTGKGEVYDKTKYVWLQCRQVWMMSSLLSDSPSLNNPTDENTSELRSRVSDCATHGVSFLLDHARDPSYTRCYFSLSADGLPVSIQRKLFSECFFVMALFAYARVIEDPQTYTQAATDMFKHVIHMAENPSIMGRPVLSGQTTINTLAIPMIILNVIDVIRQYDRAVSKGSPSTRYAKEAAWCIERILLHIHSDKRVVLENVSPTGEYLNSAEGRLLNPGHAIEAGWFLLQFNSSYHSPSSPLYQLLRQAGLNMIEWSFNRGWDHQYKGLYYFLDASDKFSPVQLEWDMKLWWPHCEALVAFLYAYKNALSVESSLDYLHKFAIVLQYTLQTFHCSDGEWFGYCNRRNEVTHQFVGSPYKGCFHVPRALFYCGQLLSEIIESIQSKVQAS